MDSSDVNGNPVYKITVMMLGGRRTGKSSVLAAMQGCFDEVLGDIKLKVSTSDMDTRDEMVGKRQEIKDIYNQWAKAGVNFTPDRNPTMGDKKYTFDLKMTAADDILQIEFVDLPGEWFKPQKDDPDREENGAFVAETIKRSQVLMIVIDTPYMMEGDRTNNWNENRNLCDMITGLLKSNMENIHGDLPKMVMFVPLKCEKYREEQTMRRVVEKVEESYKNLITFLTTSDPKSEIIAAPIFTMGTALFSHFERDDNKDVKVQNGIPERPLYHINKTGRDLGTPSPKYCEQPLVCTIAYALTMAKSFAEARQKIKEETNPFVKLAAEIGGILSEKFKNWAAHVQSKCNTFDLARRSDLKLR